MRTPGRSERSRPTGPRGSSGDLTAVAAGRYLVRYQLAAALQPAARAIRADGLPAGGVFAVTISGSPRIPYVQDNGQVVYSP